MMIKIERASPPEDTGLDKKRKKELRKIRKLAESGELKSKDFRALWSEAKVKKFLYESQYGKCCYCERKRDKIEVDVEHFRPKAGVEEAEDHPGYWWLAYNWENLLIACKKCNQEYKKSKFPLKQGSERAYGENSALDEEKPILINLLEEDPEKFIDYDTENLQFMGKAAGVLNSIKNGTSLSSVRRPFGTSNVSEDAKGKSEKERSRRSRGNGLMVPETLRAEA